MTVPNHWNIPFVFSNALTGVADVQDLLDEIKDVLTVDLPVGSRWINTSGDNYDSGDPEDAGRKVTLELLRDSATVMSFDVRDQNALLIRAGSVSMVGATANYEIHAGEPYIDVINTTDQEQAMAGMIDNSPADQGSSVYVYASIRRDSAGVLSVANDLITEMYMVDNTGTPVADDRGLARTETGVSAAVDDSVWPDDSVAYVSVRIETEPATSVFRLSGRMYQHVWYDETAGGIGVDVTISIDGPTNGTFRGLPPSVNGNDLRWACRK